MFAPCFTLLSLSLSPSVSPSHFSHFSLYPGSVCARACVCVSFCLFVSQTNLPTYEHTTFQLFEPLPYPEVCRATRIAQQHQQQRPAADERQASTTVGNWFYPASCDCGVCPPEHKLIFGPEQRRSTGWKAAQNYPLLHTDMVQTDWTTLFGGGCRCR